MKKHLKLIIGCLIGVVIFPFFVDDRSGRMGYAVVRCITVVLFFIILKMAQKR